jgi:hypothetical protein
MPKKPQRNIWQQIWHVVNRVGLPVIVAAVVAAYNQAVADGADEITVAAIVVGVLLRFFVQPADHIGV